MKKMLYSTMGVAIVTLLICSSAQATIIAPGTSAPVAPIVVLPGSGAIVANTGMVTATTTVGPTTLTVNYDEYVFSDNANPFCPGCLDFVIVATDNAASNTFIQNITAGSFAGNGTVLTNLGYNSVYDTLPVAVGLNPLTGNRSNDGSVVGFSYVPGDVPAGSSTDYLIIQTNARNFVPGTVSFQDGVTASGVGFGVAPEPNLVGLLMVGGLGLVFVARRRMKKEAA